MALGNSNKFEGAVKPDSITVDSYEADLSAGRITEIPNNLKMRAQYSGGNAIYVGFAPTGLAEGTNGWIIFKYTYDGSSNCTQKDVAQGETNWTARAGYTYV